MPLTLPLNRADSVFDADDRLPFRSTLIRTHKVGSWSTDAHSPHSARLRVARRRASSAPHRPPTPFLEDAPLMSGTVNDDRPRDVLPIPDITPVSSTTYDAKDPETKYPAIVPL